MTTESVPLPIYLESGSKRTFAGALEWPGWCRGGKTEAAAIEALLAYTPRYAATLQAAGLILPSFDDVTIAERLPGDVSTDFGAPGAIPAYDAAPPNAPERQRLLAVIRAGWAALDAAAAAAGDTPLRKGPRGGGRETAEIMRHVIEGDAAYLARAGVRFKPDPAAPLEAELGRIRLAIAARLEQDEPAGRWPLRYFARRLAWHTFDHAWEIEDRSHAAG